MATETTDWKKITPSALVPAIEHIRDTFDESAWKFSDVTKELCYAALHPRDVTPLALAPYCEAFRTYRMILHPKAVREFDRLVNLGTLPAIFKAYLDAFRSGLETEVLRLFRETLQIGLGNPEAIKMSPVEWAKTHVRILIRKKAAMVERWTKETCDGQNGAKRLETENDFEELVFWRKWRAPRVIYMQPSGNAAYNAADTWRREDELVTQQLLKAFSDRFILFLEIELDKCAGDAHVVLAKVGGPKVDANQHSIHSSTLRQVSKSQTPSRHNIQLGPKKQDLSKYLDSAELTARQLECISLRLEYGIKKSEIARYLGIDRKTLDEHLAAAERKIQINAAKQRTARPRG
jgi:predicted DNA-binding protein (UPF0251 family)